MFWMKILHPTGINQNDQHNNHKEGYSEDALTKYANNSVKAHSKFLLTQMFRAAAPENVRQLISYKD
jgi:hypothetical protein